MTVMLLVLKTTLQEQQFMLKQQNIIVTNKMVPNHLGIQCLNDIFLDISVISIIAYV